MNIVTKKNHVLSRQNCPSDHKSLLRFLSKIEFASVKNAPFFYTVIMLLLSMVIVIDLSKTAPALDALAI